MYTVERDPTIRRRRQITAPLARPRVPIIFFFFLNNPPPTEIYPLPHPAPLPILEETGPKTISNTTPQTNKLKLYQQSSQNKTRDEPRHLVATMALLRAMSQEFTEEQKLTVTRQ